MTDANDPHAPGGTHGASASRGDRDVEGDPAEEAGDWTEDRYACPVPG